MTSILESINSNPVAINSLLSLVTIFVSLTTVIVTSKNAKRQQEQFERSFENQRKQYIEEKSHNELIGRLHEQPYLVFSNMGEFGNERDTVYRINLYFTNKGRGSAYDIIPELKCKAEGDNIEIEMIRCEPIQDPIALVNEKLVTSWRINTKSGKLNFLVNVPIKYKDASGRHYVQIYALTIANNGEVMVTNYANPKLLED